VQHLEHTAKKLGRVVRGVVRADLAPVAVGAGERMSAELDEAVGGRGGRHKRIRRVDPHAIQRDARRGARLGARDEEAEEARVARVLGRALAAQVSSKGSLNSARSERGKVCSARPPAVGSASLGLASLISVSSNKREREQLFGVGLLGVGLVDEREQQ